MPHVLRAFPTLVRVGLCTALAYRTEFVLWILTSNTPLIMMALWDAVAAEGPVGGLDRPAIHSYYLATLLVRAATSSGMAHHLTGDIMRGGLAGRLMKPLHPLLGYAANQLATMPLRCLVASPAAVVLLVVLAHERLPGAPVLLGDPVRLAILVGALAGAWLLQFMVMTIIGTLALYTDRALSVVQVWMGIDLVLSGYLVPVALLPAWSTGLVRATPFWHALGFPVETAIGLLDRTTALHALGVQWLYVAGFALGAGVLWRVGMRRFVAYGG